MPSSIGRGVCTFGKTGDILLYNTIIASFSRQLACCFLPDCFTDAPAVNRGMKYYNRTHHNLLLVVFVDCCPIFVVAEGVCTPFVLLCLAPTLGTATYASSLCVTCLSTCIPKSTEQKSYCYE